MFPTEPIERYINLSFAKRSDELAKAYVADVAKIRQTIQSRSGRYFQAHMLAAVRNTKARTEAWVEIVRAACAEAKRPIDGEVRSYILGQVHVMSLAAKGHIARSIALTLQQHHMDSPNLQTALLAEADRQVSQIESDIGRELKLEELREHVRKDTETVTSSHPAPPEPSPSEDKQNDKDAERKGWTRDQKIALGVGIPLILIALITLIVTVVVPEIRARFKLDHEPSAEPQVTTPAQNPATPTETNLNQGAGSILQIGGVGNQATVNNFAPAARHIPEPDKSNFVECLKARPGKFSIGAIANNAEAYAFAQDWRDVFIKAGWKIEHKDIPIQIFMIGGGTWSGVHINVHDSSDAKEKIDLLNGSPERNLFDCGVNLKATPVSLIPYKDVPTGVVHIQVSERP